MKTGKNVLLMTPPYHCGVVEVAGKWIPLNLAFLAGAIADLDCRVTIYDSMTKNHTLSKTLKNIKQYSPDILCITAITPTINVSMEIIKYAKKINKNVVTIIGGIHPTFCYEELLQKYYEAIDFLVIGEGENTFRELIKNILSGKEDFSEIKGLAFLRDGKVIKTPARDFISNLDSVKISWDKLNWKDYEYFVIPDSVLGAVASSRGCNHECSFCSQQKFWKKQWRPFSPEKFIGEVRSIHKDFGVNVILIPDEYPTKDRPRWEEILDRLIKEKLNVYFLMETRVEDILRDRDILPKYRKAGIIHIYVGVESTNQTVLDTIRKDIKVEQSEEAIRLIGKNGIISETSFVMGFPDDSEETIKNTLMLSKRYDPDFAHFLMLTPWPYSDIYENLKGYMETADYSQFNLVEPITRTKHLTRKQITSLMVNCYKEFYSSKFRNLDSINDDFKKKYIERSFELIMKNSFLIKYLK